jgi:hypothetical protein
MKHILSIVALLVACGAPVPEEPLHVAIDTAILIGDELGESFWIDSPNVDREPLMRSGFPIPGTQLITLSVKGVPTKDRHFEIWRGQLKEPSKAQLVGVFSLEDARGDQVLLKATHTGEALELEAYADRGAQTVALQRIN